MIDEQFVNSLYESLNEDSRHYLDIAIEKIVETKKKVGKSLLSQAAVLTFTKVLQH